jgi:hypothetical protein
VRRDGSPKSRSEAVGSTDSSCPTGGRRPASPVRRPRRGRRLQLVHVETMVPEIPPCQPQWGLPCVAARTHGGPPSTKHPLPAQPRSTRTPQEPSPSAVSFEAHSGSTTASGVPGSKRQAPRCSREGPASPRPARFDPGKASPITANLPCSALDRLRRHWVVPASPHHRGEGHDRRATTPGPGPSPPPTRVAPG